MSAEPSDTAAEALTKEIESLKQRAASLKKDLKIQATALLSSEPTRKALEEANHSDREKIASRSKAQNAHDQQCLYRTCATITTFKVQDPDPNAVNNGNVLGIRIELMIDGAFKRPFYVMLNRPYKESSRHLRVHRHTVPACIPLAGLAARHLPAPKPADAEKQTTQDLSRFVRTLRREIIRYHNRVYVIRDLQIAAAEQRSRSEDTIVSINAANTEATQISLEWADARSGRLVMTEDGQIQKVIVLGEAGRDREVTRELLGHSRRVEDVLKRLPRTRG